MRDKGHMGHGTQGTWDMGHKGHKGQGTPGTWDRRDMGQIYHSLKTSHCDRLINLMGQLSFLRISTRLIGIYQKVRVVLPIKIGKNYKNLVNLYLKLSSLQTMTYIFLLIFLPAPSK